MDTDERNRSTVQYLLEHPFIKPPINSSPDGPSINNIDIKPAITSADADSNDMILGPPVSYDLSLGHSRLQQEFDFKEFLGKGGFGNVIKV